MVGDRCGHATVRIPERSQQRLVDGRRTEESPRLEANVLDPKKARQPACGIGCIQQGVSDLGYEAGKKAIEAAGLKINSAELSWLPTTLTGVSGDALKNMLKLVESLEDNDDVQNVYANYDMPSAWIEESAGS